MAAPQTPLARYPSSLSRSGPSRRPSRVQYSSPSIDDEVPPPPAPLIHKAKHPKHQPQSHPVQPHYQPPHSAHSAHPVPPPFHGSDLPLISDRPEYSSLQHLLEEAGYKETRVYTPPAEKFCRRIKKTFDEVDSEEVSALYSAYGFREHRIQHVTEPSLPLKSSSSLLRSIALQETGAYNEQPIPLFQQQQQQLVTLQQGILPSSYDSWWGGGIAALGRAAKAVMEMSPPSKAPNSFEEVARLSHGVGLGLAKGGEGVRKVKSNWELERGGRSSSTAVPKEQIPPSLESPFDLPVPKQPFPKAEYPFAPPPPAAIDEDAFGYCPLPDDYEAQCEDDELYTVGFDVDSLGDSSSPRSQSSVIRRTDSDVRESSEGESAGERSSDACLAMIQDACEGAMGNVGSPESSVGEDGLGDAGRRVLASAVEYDEWESPTKKPAPFPRPEARRASTSPSPERAPVPAKAGVEAEAEGEETAQPTIVKKPSKYGDRAAKLRMARSTPALSRSTPEGSWLGSIRHVLGYQNDAEYRPIPCEPAPEASIPAPIRISPITPAAPALVKISPVICDSTSTEAVDLPAIPHSISATRQEAKGVVGSIALRLRPSLARLRSVIGVPPPPLPTRAVEQNTTPTLSPRLNLGATGEQFAGWNWNWEDGQKSPSLPPTPALTSDGECGDKGEGAIDYSKSFFYKPATPPHPPAPSTAAGRAAATRPEAAGVSSLAAKRQRSIKSLRAALLIPVAPVPPIPAEYASSTRSNNSGNTKSPSLRTPPVTANTRMPPPALAILSPGAWEAGLPPRELVLEGEEWDARDGGVPGDWGRGRGKVRRKGNKNRGGA